jgi:hypothetical protein
VKGATSSPSIFDIAPSPSASVAGHPLRPKTASKGAGHLNLLCVLRDPDV